MGPALTSSVLLFSFVTSVCPGASGAGLQEIPVAGKAWLSRTRILTRNVLASTTPTLRSELPYASSLPEGEMLNVVTGFSDSCLV
jgi:predicted small secreted protein